MEGPVGRIRPEVVRMVPTCLPLAKPAAGPHLAAEEAGKGCLVCQQEEKTGFSEHAALSLSRLLSSHLQLAKRWLEGQPGDQDHTARRQRNWRSCPGRLTPGALLPLRWHRETSGWHSADGLESVAGGWAVPGGKHSRARLLPISNVCYGCRRGGTT